MRDEQYYALAKLVRKPMRRWWAKVGSWWMVGLGVLIIVDALQAVYIYYMVKTQFASEMYSQSWYQVISSLCMMIPPISIGVTLSCAVTAMVVIDGATRDTLAFSDAELRWFKYRIAILHCWPALLPVLLSCLILLSSSLFTKGDIQSVWLWITGSLRFFLGYLPWIIWLIALAIVTDRTRWQVWSLYFCGLLAGYVTILRAYFLSGIAMFPAYRNLEFSELSRTMLQIDGLVLYYGIFCLFIWGKSKYANLLSIGLGFLLLSSGIDIGFGHSQFDYFLQSGRYIQGGFEPLRFVYLNYDEPTLYMAFGGFNREFPTSLAWAIVPMMVNAFWVITHYFAFSRLMRRDWRKRESK